MASNLSVWFVESKKRWKTFWIGDMFLYFMITLLLDIFIVNIAYNRLDFYTSTAIPASIAGVLWVTASIYLKRRITKWEPRALFTLATGISTLLILPAAFAYTIWYPSTCEERIGPGGSMRYCNFANVNFNGYDFRNANLINSILVRAFLREADLSGAILDQSGLVRVDMTGAILEGASLRDVDLKGGTLVGANLTNANLSEADLRYSFFSDAIMIGAILEKALLFKADFYNADLSNAYLFEADLDHAKMRGVNFTGADLTNAEMDGTDITGAIMDNAILDRVIPHSIIGLTPEMVESVSSWVIPASDAFFGVCGGDGFPIASAYVPGPNFHPTIQVQLGNNLLNPVDRQGGFEILSISLPDSEYLDIRVLELVICDYGEAQILARQCLYPSGERIDVYIYQWTLTVISVQTGETVSSKRFQGAGITDCPPTQPSTNINGEHIDTQIIEDWLSQVINPP